MRVKQDYPMPQDVKTIFTFRTEGMKALWTNVLVTQLKSGQYKNGWWGSHQKDWAYYDQATTQLGPVTKLENLPANVLKLTGFSRMIPVIGTEMAEVVKAVEPNADVETVRKYLQEISKAIRFATLPADNNPVAQQVEAAQAPAPSAEG